MISVSLCICTLDFLLIMISKLVPGRAVLLYTLKWNHVVEQEKAPIDRYARMYKCHLT